MYFPWTACCLSTENGEHESLKSMTKTWHLKILKWGKKKKKKKDQLTQEKKKQKKLQALGDEKT